MSTVEQIEAAVRQLSPEDRAAFRAWFAEFDAQECDRQLESDAEAIEESREDKRAGRLESDNSITSDDLALKLESERALVEQIRRLQALPMNKRTNFLRVRHPKGGSHL